MAIGNKNPAIRELVPELMGGIGSDLVRQDPQRPNTNWLRPVHVSTRIGSSYVVPGDWPAKPDGWFADDAPTYPLRRQNNVEYFIDGEPTFEAMVEAIETATGPDHFIVLLGWACHVDFPLSKNASRCMGARRTLLEILKERVDLGVLVRVLLYYNTPGDPDPWGSSVERKTKADLDALEPTHPPPPGVSKIRCILDNGIKKVSGGVIGDCDETVLQKVMAMLRISGPPLSRSSHHQKILLVYGGEGLVGFFGGVDVNSDRVNRENVRVVAGPALTDVHGPLHDVHMRVAGEAAEDLLVLAVNRWNFSVPFEEIPEIELCTPTLTPLGTTTTGRPVYYTRGDQIQDLRALLNRARAAPTAPRGPHHVVKIAHTVGNPALAKLQDNGVWPMIRHAIQQAKRFIYVEDQYLWSLDAAEELGKAVERLSHITIILPPDDQMPKAELRYRALKRMKEIAGAHAEKIRIYIIREDVHQYIHSKMWIFDDECLIVGSANCNNRGYFTDSEVTGTITDPEWEWKAGPRGGYWWSLELNLAHRLRIELWAEHLRMPEGALVDGVAAELHWRSPPTNARITPYTILREDGTGKRKYLWHECPFEDYETSYYLSIFAIADPKI